MLKLFRSTGKTPRYLAIGVVALLIVSCGDPGGEDSLPVGANVDISPAGKTWILTAAVPPPCLVTGPFTTSNHTISVKNATGQTLLGVPISISIDLSAANYTGPTLLELFLDANENGIPEASESISSNYGTYNTDTSKENGAVKVIVRMNQSCRYGGALTVQAGTVSGTAQFEIVE